MKAKQEIGLLGGSFNPPHVAHMMAAYWALTTQRVREVWLVPSYRHPFGKELAPFRDRLRMCELAAARLRGIRVCRAEQELRRDPLVGKTVRTLEYLSKQHPGRRFALIVGSDILSEMAKWYRFDRVKELARLIVVARTGFPGGSPTAPELPPVSSTAVREGLRKGGDVSEWVPSCVLEYIERRGLYR
jgi:nicotinate-nucleotide adenylyltransferase